MKLTIPCLLLFIALVACSKQKTNDSLPSPTPEGIAYGINVPGKPGFVKSPYEPEKGWIDVRGFPVNTEVRDPYTKKIFLVPEISEPASTNSSK